METCRACLHKGVDLLPMDEKLVVKYNILTNLNIKMEDDSPYACTKCLDGLLFCYEFRQKCIESYQTLQEVLISKKESSVDKEEEVLVTIKTELKIEHDTSDTEFIDDCYNYGVDYVHKNESKDEIPKIYGRKYEKHDDFDARLVCGLCPSILKSKDELTDHLENHKTDSNCGQCTESLINMPHLLGHRMTHVPATQKNCHICSKRLMTPESFEFHYMRDHDMAEKDAPILCKICLKPYLSVKLLKQHMAHHKEAKFTCDYCSKKFRRRQRVKDHIIMKHSDKTKSLKKCNLCDYTYTTYGAITSHKLRHHTASKVSCETCGRYFPNQGKLNKHECKHRLPVICPVCGVTFQAKGRNTFNEHMKTHTNLYSCPLCPRTFKSRVCFRDHKDRHEGTPRFRCETCDREFYNQPSLYKHRRTHTGERPYVCKICSRGFIGNHNLKLHMKVHGVHNLIKKKDGG